MGKVELTKEQIEQVERWEKEKRFWNNPKKYLRLDELGDLHLQLFNDRYAALRLKQRLPIFNRAYKIMTKRGNFSRKNAFGEMHGDNYMWIEKCDHAKVIAHETQSNLYLFIHTAYGHDFHMRELTRPYLYPDYERHRLKGATLSAYRKANFKNSTDNPIVFRYGDARDIGYLGSAELWLKGSEKLEHANSRILFTMGLMNYWQIYLDDPTQLE